MILKEFIQMQRDRLTFAMMVGIPIIQLMLFGFAINSDPKHLPTVVLSYDNSDLTRSFVAALQNTRLLPDRPDRREPARRSTGCSTAARSLFAVTIPAGFTRDAAARRPARNCWSRPTPPTRSPPATPWARSARSNLQALAHDLKGPLEPTSRPDEAPFDLRIHRRYNPEGLTSYNIVPGSGRHDPDHDHGDHDGAGGHPRARARHHGEPAGHAGHAARGDARQAAAVHRRRR